MAVGTKVMDFEAHRRKNGSSVLITRLHIVCFKLCQHILRIILCLPSSSHRSFSTKTCHGKKEGETSTLGECSITDSCMLSSGRMNHSYFPNTMFSFPMEGFEK